MIKFLLYFITDRVAVGKIDCIFIDELTVRLDSVYVSKDNKSSIIIPEVFHTCCLLRLGLPIPSVPTFCYGCRDRTDSLGTHLFSCT